MFRENSQRSLFIIQIIETETLNRSGEDIEFRSGVARTTLLYNQLI